MNKWAKQLQFTLDPSTVVPTHSLTPGDGPVHDEENNHQDVFIGANTQHIESRLDHARGLEKMHKSAMQLAENCLTFNDLAWRGWSTAILTHTSSSERSEATIHHLFDVLTTFNALFYASNQLASATMVLGNVMYTILTLDNKTNHKAF